MLDVDPNQSEYTTDSAITGVTFIREYFRGTKGRVYLSAIRNARSPLAAGEIDKRRTRLSTEVNAFIGQHDKPEHDCAIYFCTATILDGRTTREAADCWQFPSLFADCDDHNHDLDRARVIELLETAECPPTAIVNSGHGLQPHWLLSEPCEDFPRIEAYRKRLQALTASDAVHDAPRLMRLPGSHNSKNGDWLKVEIVSWHPERRYKLEVLEEWLDQAATIIPRKAKEKKGNGTATFVVPPATESGTDRKRGEAWATAALQASAADLANAGEGTRHNTLRGKSIRMGTMIARGWIDALEVRRVLFAAAEACGQIKDYGVGHFNETFTAGITYGLKMPHPDLPDDDPPLSNTGIVDRSAGPEDHSSGDQPVPNQLEANSYQCIDAWWRDPATIPRRQWLYGRHYVRKAIGATVGAGGRAKTTLGHYEAICMAVGRDLATGEPLPTAPLRVLVLNGEEDQDELDRRIAATCQHYGITKADLGGRLFAKSVRDKPLRLATLVRNAPALNQGLLDQLEADIKAKRIDVFMIDPLVSFHSVLENDNGHMDLLIKEGLGGIASRTDSAGEVFHHPGKPKLGQDTTVEDARGASAVIWAARSARVLNFMTPDEASKLGISEDDRRLHIRVANGKANMGPIGKAKWMHLVIENLPNGDEIAVASHWNPPDPFQGVTTAHMELARQLARTGEYRADSRSPKWFGYAVADALKITTAYRADNDPKDLARLNAIIKTWLKNKVLEVENRKDEKGRDRDFIVAGSFKPEPLPTAYPSPYAATDDDDIAIH